MILAFYVGRKSDWGELQSEWGWGKETVIVGNTSENFAEKGQLKGGSITRG